MIGQFVMLAGDESQLCNSACLLLLDHKKLFNTFSTTSNNLHHHHEQQRKSLVSCPCPACSGSRPGEDWL
jgi:hypothetical protein